MDALMREASRLRADGEYAQRKLDWLAAQAEAAEERARDAELAAAAAAAAAAKQVRSASRDVGMGFGLPRSARATPSWQPRPQPPLLQSRCTRASSALLTCPGRACVANIL